VSNIVFMGAFRNSVFLRVAHFRVFVAVGMGEPLYNIRAVERAVAVIAHPAGAAIGRRRIIVSTSGVVPHMPRLRALGVGVAISLHAVDDDTRSELVPLNRMHAACLIESSTNVGCANGRTNTGGR
jgi:23S rRNA (adenine2503-C2)-methyltransferase